MFTKKIDDNITLRMLRIEDAEALFELTDDSRDYLREWLPWLDTTTTIDDSRSFIEHTLDYYRKEKGLTTGIFYQTKLVGIAGFNSFQWTNKIGFIGYWLGEGFQGKGIMTQAIQALVDLAFFNLKLNRVDIRAAYENEKSRAIPERLGFTREGQLRQAEWLYDHYVDHVVYSMLANEWIMH